MFVLSKWWRCIRVGGSREVSISWTHPCPAVGVGRGAWQGRGRGAALSLALLLLLLLCCAHVLLNGSVMFVCAAFIARQVAMGIFFVVLGRCSTTKRFGTHVDARIVNDATLAQMPRAGYALERQLFESFWNELWLYPWSFLVLMSAYILCSIFSVMVSADRVLTVCRPCADRGPPCAPPPPSETCARVWHCPCLLCALVCAHMCACVAWLTGRQSKKPRAAV